jgi:hypothetical protein
MSREERGFLDSQPGIALGAFTLDGPSTDRSTLPVRRHLRRLIAVAMVTIGLMVTMPGEAVRAEPDVYLFRTHVNIFRWWVAIERGDPAVFRVQVVARRSTNGNQRMQDPLEFAPVELWARPTGATRWRRVDTAQTDITSEARLAHRPRRTTDYQVRYDGEWPIYSPSRDGRRTVVIRR